jgi:2-keto-4-pentenoate hydratase/2-oxohepta-3-ene-1,7-dioic acid hydratase in catechol pathway
MKILAIETILEEYEKEASFACYPDSSIIRNNEHFYIPNFDTNIEAYCGIYFKIGKIGKCIEPDFIPRYTTQIGAAINFVAVNTLKQCLAKQKPTDIARGFDKSLAISNELIKHNNTSQKETIITIQYNSINYSFTITEKLQKKIIQLLSEISYYYTVKIGDLFFIPLIQLPNTMTKNTTIAIQINTKRILVCSVQ